MSQPWFTHIKRGVKTVEGRLAKGKFASLKTGAVLIVGSGSASAKPVVAVVTRVCRYAGFKEYLEQEGLARTLPGVKGIDAGVAVYRKFYTVEAEREHGVLAIHMVVAS